MEGILGELDGVVGADADYIQGIATVRYDPSRISPAQMVEVINIQTFYEASMSEVAASSGSGRRRVPLPLLIGGGLALLAGAIVYRVTLRMAGQGGWRD